VAYEVQLKPAAQRQLGRLRGVDYYAVRGVILGLAYNARPAGSTRLVGTRSTWRVRVRIDGEAWRVIYQIDDASQLVIIARVVRRDEGTYRSL
jgi:mRNA-degrading endonuclease RelE of RelBE toxin-antitoxin system